MSVKTPTLKQMISAISRPPEGTGHPAAFEATALHLFLLRLAQDIPEVAARITERYASRAQGD
jgi:hypothetical protein